MRRILGLAIRLLPAQKCNYVVALQRPNKLSPKIKPKSLSWTLGAQTILSKEKDGASPSWWPLRFGRCGGEWAPSQAPWLWLKQPVTKPRLCCQRQNVARYMARDMVESCYLLMLDSLQRRGTGPDEEPRYSILFAYVIRSALDYLPIFVAYNWCKNAKSKWRNATS